MSESEEKETQLYTDIPADLKQKLAIRAIERKKPLKKLAAEYLQKAYDEDLRSDTNAA